MTALDPTMRTATLSLFERLFVSDRVELSSTILNCVEMLQYTPGKNYRQKSAESDLSVILEPLRLFTEALLRVLFRTSVTPKAGINFITMRRSVALEMPSVVAADELIPFFTNWNIRVVDSSTMPSATLLRQPSSLTQLGMKDHDARDLEASETERRALLAELDVFNTAIDHRQQRWIKTFPRPKLDDMQFPDDYSRSEREQIRDFVRKHLDANNLWERDISVEQQKRAVLDIKDDPAFPVMHGRSASVIQAALIKVRHHFTKKREARLSSESTSSVSTSESPLKRLFLPQGGRPKKARQTTFSGKNEATDEDDEEEDMPVVHPVRGGKQRSSLRNHTMLPSDEED